ncbi:hypothetical protein C8J57DRAFT_1508495 [Mycena rebaudengoi]|nr:hypothetical protein C8J57DRAFT_1508495 [Mycena rebaudengoi]
MPSRIWSSSITSFEELLQYVRTSRPLAFCNCTYQVDFHGPVPYRGSAFTNDGETVFYTTLFGKAEGPVGSSHRSRTLRLEWGDEGGEELHALFNSQFLPFRALVLDDDDQDEVAGTLQNIAVTMCTDINRATGGGGSYFDLVCVPTRVEDYAVRTGDWVVAVVSIRKQSVLTRIVKAYDMIVRELCVLNLSDNNVANVTDEADQTDTHEDVDSSDTTTLHSNEGHPDPTVRIDVANNGAVNVHDAQDLASGNGSDLGSAEEMNPVDETVLSGTSSDAASSGSHNEGLDSDCGTAPAATDAGLTTPVKKRKRNQRDGESLSPSITRHSKMRKRSKRTA